MTCSMIGERRIGLRSKVYESWAPDGRLDVMNYGTSLLGTMSLINGSTLNSPRVILRPSDCSTLWARRSLTFPSYCSRTGQNFWKACQLKSPRKWDCVRERKQVSTISQSSAEDRLAWPRLSIGRRKAYTRS